METFEKWYQANKEGDILNEGYHEYKSGSDEIPLVTFKQWCKRIYEFETKQ